MNVVGLYAATCRSALLARPDSAETVLDLESHLEILRQALACRVCAGVLNVPVAPADTICQHHVCRTCVGGRMRVKPTCSWCKNWDDFIEKPQLRSLIQCFKGLCRYLLNSAVAAHLGKTSNGGKTSVYNIVQEGAAIRDEFRSAGPDLGGFKQLLTVKKEVVADAIVNNVPEIPHQDLPECKTEESVVDLPSQNEVTSGENLKDSLGVVNCNNVNNKKRAKYKTKKLLNSHLESRKSASTKISNLNLIKVKRKYKKRKPKIKVEKKLYKKKSIAIKTESEKHPKKLINQERNIFQTVAAEHDYNVTSWMVSDSPRARTRQTSGHRSEASSPSKSPPSKRQKDSTGSDILGSLEYEGSQSILHPITRILPPQSQTVNILKQQATQNPKMSWTVKPKKRVIKKPKPKGCRCGLATPNPGKLTCCGQRCPCYSVFKGCCPDCKCRGCRNPRKLVPDQPLPSYHSDLFAGEAITLTEVSSASEESDIEIDI